MEALSSILSPVIKSLGPTPLPSSSTWNLRFSSKITVPSAGLEQTSSTEGPTQSAKKTTFLKVKRR
uniref:Uncharacterized protein n=1 Tax=Romanomermis culicivorax TaxID=13658 RepID=A0A915K6W8_ROMCU